VADFAKGKAADSASKIARVIDLGGVAGLWRHPLSTISHLYLVRTGNQPNACLCLQGTRSTSFELND